MEYSKLGRPGEKAAWNIDYSQEWIGEKLGAFWILAALLIMQQHPLGQVASFFHS